MSEQSIIPLLPLSVVIFPGQTLPLHIFEPRYITLLADCRAAVDSGEELPIGISFGQDTTVQREIGCSVVLEKILHEYEDGRLDIITTGRKRYRLVEIYDPHPYLTAAVEFFGDDEEVVDPLSIEQLQRCYERLNELVEVETGASLERPIPEHSFQFALAAGLELEVRQTLLEMKSENQRLQMLLQVFDKLIAGLEVREKELRKIRSNGKPRRM